KNKDNPTNKSCSNRKMKETSPICKYGTLIAFIILTAVLLLHIGVLIYGSFIVIKPIDKIKGSLYKLNNMLNDIIDFTQEVEIFDEDNYTRSCTFDDFIYYVESDAIEFEAYAKLMSISTQMARDAIDVVNANLEDARETIISQTEKMLQVVSESFSGLDMSEEYVSQILKYYYGPTQDTDQNPLEKLLKQFVNSGLSQSDMVKEVLPKENNSHSIIIQDVYSYSDYIDEYPNATIQPMIAYNEPFYCDPTEALDIIGSKPDDTEARVCWNVLGDVIQQQMDRNKTALWNKFDGFVDEIVVCENSGY
ncbi:MAG: hypothetical protein EZS28_031071, partial [Streblomastix strix]